MAECLLCHKDQKLCNSHVLPEFLFKPTYDSKHRAHEFTVDIARKRFIQKGYREKLLCRECEGRIAPWEKYVAENWILLRDTRANVADRISIIHGLEQTPFRLFHLSVLWRAHVSRRPEFAAVSLGPHADRIAAVLLRETLPDSTVYPFWAELLTFPDGTVVDGIIMEPLQAHFAAQRVYTFCFGGAAWYYYVSSHPAADLPTRFSDDGTLTVLETEFTKFGPLADSFARYLRNRTDRGAG